ncbi:MAG: PaaI family thioesterase [Candidatus Bathyarchaeia archaeon]
MKGEELEAIREALNGDPFARLLGIEIQEIKEGYGRAFMKVRADLLNSQGFAHGGAIFSLADMAFAAASNSHNRVAVALSVNVNYRKPVREGMELLAEAFEESLGRSTALYRILVRTKDGELIAACQGLAFRMDREFLGTGSRANHRWTGASHRPVGDGFSDESVDISGSWRG